MTYIPAALIHTINDEWQFENSHTSALRCAMAAAAPSEAADAMANCSEAPNLKMQDVLRRLLNLVRPLSFEQMP